MQITPRQTKLNKIINSNKEAYPRNFPNREQIKTLLQEFNISKSLKLDIPSHSYRIAGRVIKRRNLSKHIFLDLFDQTGYIQLLLIKASNPLSSEIENLDLGDCVGVEGELTSNAHQKPILEITDLVLLAKALIEPPDKFKGLKNPEMKYRPREL